MSDWYKGKCPECGKVVPVISKSDVRYCSKQCETNSKYRNIRFRGTEREKTLTPDEVRKFKFK